MRHMKVWFPEFFTEAHRKPGEGDVLVAELAKFGIECVRKLDRNCSFIFCGTIWKMNLCNEQRKRFPKIPVIHYNWDLYPFQLFERPDYQRANPDLWDPYLIELQNCRDIWVPSRCTVDRTKEFTGRDSYVIKSSVRVWDNPIPIEDYGFALDVMRKYPDPNRDAAITACKAAKVSLVSSCTEMPWNDYKKAVVTCRFLISAQFEASTGGLSLIEGLWHGKPCLLSNSPRHGGIDYLGDYARYFQWDNPLLMKNAVREMYDNPPVIDIDEAREFIVKEHSEYAMAERMAKRFWELYDESA